MQKHKQKPITVGKDDMIREQEPRAGASQPTAEGQDCAQPGVKLDLDRLVWDAEYRKSVRHLWQEDD